MDYIVKILHAAGRGCPTYILRAEKEAGLYLIVIEKIREFTNASIFNVFVLSRPLKNMPVAQVTVPDQGSRDETLRIAFRAKQQLTDSVRDARDAALRGIHWLDSNQAYFELDVPSLERATQALQGFQVGGNEIIGITVAPANPVKGDPCLNCGNISPSSTPPICPSCRFQEISPCPYCNQLSSRMLYTRAEGQLFHCPECNHRVRMRYNEPLFTRDGNYRTPVVLVDRAEPEVE